MDIHIFSPQNLNKWFSKSHLSACLYVPMCTWLALKPLLAAHSSKPHSLARTYSGYWLEGLMVGYILYIFSAQRVYLLQVNMNIPASNILGPSVGPQNIKMAIISKTALWFWLNYGDDLPKIKLHRQYVQENNGTHTRGTKAKYWFCQNRHYWSGDFIAVEYYLETTNGLPCNYLFCFQSTAVRANHTGEGVCVMSLHRFPTYL